MALSWSVSNMFFKLMDGLPQLPNDRLGLSIDFLDNVRLGHLVDSLKLLFGRLQLSKQSICELFVMFIDLTFLRFYFLKGILKLYLVFLHLRYRLLPLLVLFVSKL